MQRKRERHEVAISHKLIHWLSLHSLRPILNPIRGPAGWQINQRDRDSQAFVLWALGEGWERKTGVHCNTLMIDHVSKSFSDDSHSLSQPPTSLMHEHVSQAFGDMVTESDLRGFPVQQKAVKKGEEAGETRVTRTTELRISVRVLPCDGWTAAAEAGITGCTIYFLLRAFSSRSPRK